MKNDVILKKMSSLTRCLKRLEEKRPETWEILIEDYDLQDIISINLERAVQLSVDIGLQFLLELNIQPPETMGEVFPLLGKKEIFQTALSYHQILPERTHAVMSAGFRMNKEYSYDTPLGRYSFHYVPERVFSIGIIPAEEVGAAFRIATAEKALCDTLYKIRKIENITGISELLFEDLSIERESIDVLDWDLINSMIPLYRSTTLRTLMKWKKTNA
jgi:hypothetical protein